MPTLIKPNDLGARPSEPLPKVRDGDPSSLRSMGNVVANFARVPRRLRVRLFTPPRA